MSWQAMAAPELFTGVAHQTLCNGVWQVWFAEVDISYGSSINTLSDKMKNNRCFTI